MLCLLVWPYEARAQTGTVLVRHAPTINGRVEGSIQMMTAENVTVGQDAGLSGNLLLPGTPAISQHATSALGIVLEGPGAATPSSHSVALSAGSSLRGLVHRVDAVDMPVVPTVPTPAGTRNVTLTTPGQSPGDFATLKNLTLNGGLGMVTIPPGNYGEFFAFSGSGFVLGVDGATTPAIYNFKSLGMLSGTALRVVGPVVVSADLARILGAVGHPDHPEWMNLSVNGGSIYASGGQAVHAHVTMPSGILNIGTGTLFEGMAIVDSLVVGSGAVMRVTGPLAVPPLIAGFEATEGYTLGSLHGQSEWLASNGIDVTDADAASGLRSVVVPGATPPGSLLRLFDQHPGQNVVFTDLLILPHAAANVDASVRLSLHNTARLAFVRTGEQGHFMHWAGNGTGGGVWRQSVSGLPLDAQGYVTDWLRVTLRLDYATKEWDFYVNGTMLGAAIGFEQASQPSVTALTLTGQAANSTLLDDVLIAFDNPLFADVDRDGMDDSWESNHGLNPTMNDRRGDPDADGLTNVHEYISDTVPTEADIDQDGLLDGFEVQHGFDPWTYTYPTDEDEDGFSQIQEAVNGTDPADYFNGATPEITILSDEGSPTGEFVVKVHKPDGTPYPNAPVTFSVPATAAALAGNQDSTNLFQTIVRRTGADGVVRIFIRPPISSE